MNAHLNSEGKRSLTGLTSRLFRILLVRNQLHFCMKQFFHFKINLAQTQKDRRSDVHEISPSRIIVSVPCFSAIATVLHFLDLICKQYFSRRDESHFFWLKISSIYSSRRFVSYLDDNKPRFCTIIYHDSALLKVLDNSLMCDLPRCDDFVNISCT